MPTTATKLEPNLLSDSRKNKSPIKIPNRPLTDKVIKSSPIKIGKGIENTSKVKIKPKTPIKFLIKFRCKGSKFFDETSNKITAEDQQKAVIIAYKSPIDHTVK